MRSAVGRSARKPGVGYGGGVAVRLALGERERSGGNVMAPPSRSGGVREIRAIREPFRLLARRSRLESQAVHRRVVVTVPGVGSNGLAMAPLRWYLAAIGHRPYDWGLGRGGNCGFESSLSKLIDRVAELQERHGVPVDLIGWSLGGMLARGVGRTAPTSIGRIITYGTPVVGGPRFTILAESFDRSDIADIERRIDEARRSYPLTVPVTAIYSRNDGVVAWEACIDPDDRNIEHVEVASSHFGMNLDPDVWGTISERLDQAPTPHPG